MPNVSIKRVTYSLGERPRVNRLLNRLRRSYTRFQHFMFDVRPGDSPCFVAGMGMGGEVDDESLSFQSPAFLSAKRLLEANIMEFHEIIADLYLIAELNLTEADGFALAKIAAAQNGSGTSEYIQNYQLTQNQRFEVAKIAAAQDGFGTSKHFHNYLLTDESQCFEVAKIAAAQNSVGPSVYIENYKLSDVGMCFEVAKIAAAQDGWRTSKYIENYNLIEDQRFEVARIAAAQNGRGTSEYIQNYHLTEDQRFEVAKIAILQDIGALRFLNNYGGVLNSFDINADFSKEDFTSYLKKVLLKLNLDPALADHLYSDMGRRDVGVRLFAQLIRETQKAISTIPQPLGHNLTRYLLARLTGLEPNLLYGRKFSPIALGNFYALCLELQAGSQKKALAGVAFSEKLFSNRSLRQLMAFLRSAGRLKNILGHEFDQYRKEIFPPEITPENISQLVSRLHDLFLVRFQQVFLLEDKQITFQQIEQLEKLWGDLEVLFTLAASFRGNRAWDEELPALSKVAAAVLNRSFSRLKYQGDPQDAEDQEKAAAQLAMLKTDQARAGWMADYQRLAVFSSRGQAGRTSEAELLARSQAQLDQLARHLGAQPTDRHALKELKQLIISNPKYQTIKGIDPALVVSTCLELLREARDIRSYQAILSLLKGSAGSLGLSRQIEEDLRFLGDLLKYKETGQEAIVFSTTTDDPKLLLMTGALVDASSCQDYRFGSHAHTLLGYVIDAGIKLVLSYGLREGHFASAGDYQEAKRLIQAGTQPVFVPARQLLKIGPLEIALPKALKRRVIKLGETGSMTAGIRAETEYAQNHFAEGLMEAQIEEILAELAKKSEAEQAEKITIPPSRNPLGVYSDLAGGVMTEAYTI